MTAIQAALDRTTPGYGGDQPETDIEALYQVVTGLGFDGNNNGSVLDSGVAGLASTQLNPGASGDVPSFASFMADPAASVMPAAGTIGGVGFRAGALPIILTATDTGLAYQPQGETTIVGVGGLTLPVSALTETSRPTTPFNAGAGLQETVTGLNALGALVIGLGTNPQANLDPRQGLEALSKLTGAINRSTTTIDNGTADPIAPGDPLYFQIASGFSASVANGVVSAIQNAVTSVAVDITVQASDPRVKIVNHTGVVAGVSSGQTATFDVEFVGDGVPHRFDLQFVRAGTQVVLGSIPVVLGTPVPGDGYEFADLAEGEIEFEDDFGDHLVTAVAGNVAPSFTAGDGQSVPEDSAAQSVVGWATKISAGPASEAGQVVDFLVSNDNTALFSIQPAIAADGTLTYTPAANAFGLATVTVQIHDDGGTAGGGADTSGAQTFAITVSPVNDAPDATHDDYTTDEDTPLTVAAAGVLSNDSDVEHDVLSAVLVNSPAHGSLTLNGDGSFTYTPAANFAGTDGFTYKAHDGLADSDAATVSITVNAVNDAPMVNTPINDSTAYARVPFQFTVPADTFADVDAGDTLALSSSCADGSPLPAWLVFDTATGSFSGTPSSADGGELGVVVTASDSGTPSQSAAAPLTIRVIAHPWQNPVDSLDVNGDAEVSPADVLIVINTINAHGSGSLPARTPSDAGLPPYVDVNGDDSTTASDVLILINFINQRPAGVLALGEGEADAPDSLPGLTSSTKAAPTRATVAGRLSNVVNDYSLPQQQSPVELGRSSWSWRLRSLAPAPYPASAGRQAHDQALAELAKGLGEPGLADSLDLIAESVQAVWRGNASHSFEMR
jgi:VCBS repeat-containing protein